MHIMHSILSPHESRVPQGVVLLSIKHCISFCQELAGCAMSYHHVAMRGTLLKLTPVTYTMLSAVSLCLKYANVNAGLCILVRT